MVLLIQHIFQLKVSRSTSNGLDFNSSSIEDCTIIVCTDFHSIRIERLHKDELCKGTPLGSQARPMIHSTWGKTLLEISSDSCCIVGISKGEGGRGVSYIWGYHLKLGSRHSELNNRSRNQSKFIHHIHWNLLYSLKSKFIKWKTKRTYPR